MNKVKIVISGVSGRMGATILRVALSDSEIEVVGATEIKENKAIGMDIGELSGIRKTGITVESEINKFIDKLDVLIEFTSPKATLEHLEEISKHNKKMVIGTTGFNDTELQKLKELSKNIPIVFSPNMSIGVNILFKLTEELSGLCPNGYDIEITEAHHRFKKDAPSGTAKKLSEIIVETRKIDFDKKTIPIHSIREGDIVGEHTVSFIGLGERIELIHKAHNRDTFAIGSLLAAKFLINANPGIHEMKDVLGIR